MAAKRFHVATPEQLKELNGMVTSGKLENMVRTWAATARRCGKSRWDDAFIVGFSGDQNRIAEVWRITNSQELVYCASVRYNTALRYCGRNMRQIE